VQEITDALHVFVYVFRHTPLRRWLQHLLM